MAVGTQPGGTMIYTFRGKWIAGFILVCVGVLLWVRHTALQKSPADVVDFQDPKTTPSALYAKIPGFTNQLVSFDQISSTCYQNKRPESIEDLSKFVALLHQNRQHKLCGEQYKLFKVIYAIRTKQTTVVLSETFLPKVQKWMNGNQELVEATKKQTIIFVDNKWSLESVVFNPVRAKRPGGQGQGSVAEYVNNLIDKAKEGCDFCSYKKYTAADDFGMLESERTVAISNTFKIEKYHGMIVFKQHDPVHFDQDQFIDAMDLAMRWFKTAAGRATDHKYRHMYWDCLPKASASQVHPHIHLALGDHAYYAKWNRLHKAALEFSESVPNWNYWNAMLQVHNALGLSAHFNSASIISYITPQKDLEIVILAKKPSQDFFRLFYFAVRTFMEDMGQFAISAGCVFPKLDVSTDNGAELPAICRLLSRGAADLPRSDVSSFDLFGTANVNKDPFVVIKKVKTALERLKTSKFTYQPKYME